MFYFSPMCGIANHCHLHRHHLMRFAPILSCPCCRRHAREQQAMQSTVQCVLLRARELVPKAQAGLCRRLWTRGWHLKVYSCAARPTRGFPARHPKRQALWRAKHAHALGPPRKRKRNLQAPIAGKTNSGKLGQTPLPRKALSPCVLPGRAQRAKPHIPAHYLCPLAAGDKKASKACLAHMQE